MNDGTGKTIAGICHARGGNASIPPMWIPYITVNSLDDSLAKVSKSGEKLINGLSHMPQGKYAIISDPAGACCAIWEKNE